VHEDFAMLMRYQVLSDDPNSPQYRIIPTPIPGPDGVTYIMKQDVLPEAWPKKSST
jgi:hypothetical protein